VTEKPDPVLRWLRCFDAVDVMPTIFRWSPPAIRRNSGLLIATWHVDDVECSLVPDRSPPKPGLRCTIVGLPPRPLAGRPLPAAIGKHEVTWQDHGNWIATYINWPISARTLVAAMTSLARELRIA